MTNPPYLSNHAQNVARTNAQGHSLSAAATKLATEHSSSAAAKLGHRSTPAKAAAAQANGKQGGRPVGS